MKLYFQPHVSFLENKIRVLDEYILQYLSFSKLNFCSVDSIINNKKIHVVFLCTKSNESMKYAEIIEIKLMIKINFK